MLSGSPDLKIGTVLLVFSCAGKMPVRRLRLKMWLSGMLSSVAQALRREVLIPSRSGLDLLAKDLIISVIWMGLTPPSSRCGIWGSVR